MMHALPIEALRRIADGIGEGDHLAFKLVCRATRAVMPNSTWMDIGDVLHSPTRLQWCEEMECPETDDDELCEEAAKLGILPTLQFVWWRILKELKEHRQAHHMLLGLAEAAAEAAADGWDNFDVFIARHTSRKFTLAAASTGKLCVLRWARRERLSMCSKSCLRVALTNHHKDVARWLRKKYQLRSSDCPFILDPFSF